MTDNSAYLADIVFEMRRLTESIDTANQLNAEKNLLILQKIKVIRPGNLVQAPVAAGYLGKEAADQYIPKPPPLPFAPSPRRMMRCDMCNGELPKAGRGHNCPGDVI